MIIFYAKISKFIIIIIGLATSLLISSRKSLKFLTAKGETHEVGRVRESSKPFEFDINEYEYPAVICGGLEIEYRKHIEMIC